jgi:hypothetical protein
MLSQEEYLAARGLRCPNCGAVQIEGDSIDIEDSFAYQGVCCLKCEASWVDTYRLVSFDSLEVVSRIDRLDRASEGPPPHDAATATDRYDHDGDRAID